jgi:hypothetical protein
VTEPLTSRMIFDQVREATDSANLLNIEVRNRLAEELHAKHELEIAKDNLKRAEAEHFALAKESGATEGLANADAIRKTQIEREILREKRGAYDKAKGLKEQAESEARTLTKIIEDYAGISYALNRELKTFAHSQEAS